MSIMHDYMDIGGRVKQGENHAMMAFERETWRSNWLFNKDVIARTEEQLSTRVILFRDPFLASQTKMDSGQ